MVKRVIPNVLAVDDEEIIWMLFVVMFGHDGCYYAVTTTDSRQVLDILRRRPCDVTLLDMSMPTISGLEVLRQETSSVHSFSRTSKEPPTSQTRVYLNARWSIESIV